MPNAEWTIMWDVFHRALELDGAERESFVRGACADPALCRQVLKLLRSHDASNGFIEPPAHGRQDLNLADQLDHDLPERVGNYVIKEKIGEGGFADVYLAEQVVPVRRTVAIKVLRPGMESRRVIARFEAERQTLAIFDHPNVATFFDAGTIGGESSRPYFVMEHIKGEPITDWCRKRSLAVGEALQLFLQACLAVQHAHHKGIIHRDLKPSNILVTAIEGKPIVKVIDFGVAKAIDHLAAGQSLATQHGQFIGTPEYMSPEQAGGSPDDVDTRTDVYSLGVLLFNLLSGDLPHDLFGLSLTDTVLKLTRDEPRKLSEVNPACRGELEIIVAKAIERDRQRRYQTPAALADDVRAYLEHRPLAARRPSTALRLRKWMRRRPAAAAAAGVALGSMLLIASLLAIDQFNAHRAQQRSTRDAFIAAMQSVGDYRDHSMAIIESRNVMHRLEDMLLRYQSHDEQEQIEGRLRQIRHDVQAHDARFYESLDLLSAAERIGATLEQVRPWRARLLWTRLREAEAGSDRFSSELYGKLAREHDPDGAIEREFTVFHDVSFLSDPPDALVHIFRLVEESSIVEAGEDRIVAIGRNVLTNPVDAGAWALQRSNSSDLVVEVAGHAISGSMLAANDSGPIRRFDRVKSMNGQAVVDRWTFRHATTEASSAELELELQRGGELLRLTVPANQIDAAKFITPAEILHSVGAPVTVWRSGSLVQSSIEPGSRFAVTTKPLFTSSATAVGQTPLRLKQFESGSYLALFMRAGFEPLRVPLHLSGTAPSMRVVRAPLLAINTTPAGFIHVVPYDPLNDNVEPFWIMEHEVTVAEYLQFLNDPGIQEEIRSAAAPRLVPRMERELLLHQNSGGQFAVPAEWEADWPVIYISWHDARAYAEWATEKLRGQGITDLYFDLPTHREWTTAWGNDGRHSFPWGSVFRTQWTSNNFARPKPWPEPAMSFPIDETHLGVKDMAGSVSEWLNAYWVRERGYMGFAGGSWGHGGVSSQSMFALYGANGAAPDRTTGTTGFRLVMRRGSEAPSPDDLPDVYGNESISK